MSFKDLMRDQVTLIKQDGRRFEGIFASVQGDKIYTDDTFIPIEEGDTFERTLPNGIVERYTILDAVYYEGIKGIKSNYQCDVRKETKIDRSPLPTQTVYNLIGPNARVNIQSVDASTNLIEIEPKDLFDKLRHTIQQEIADKSFSDKLSKKADELEQAQGTNKFVDKYREFIALAADHVTLLAPFIPALSQLCRSGCR